ncbi:SDR family oxidoreductase [Phytomonospora endophytica]|uniref:3-oxoacyl-[acyl-carrier protein] reductase n=1 Tax=Phytomonospora endophytica TaxID=714109 RepID=A0A841G2Y8_9ACTN|nr:SDR family oxidoreductase [Phytomonospora endophytica]MBB6039079.1 3-oxoacyl-[acyl-carrier protein] reductase [Phytomonospora endophytica]
MKNTDSRPLALVTGVGRRAGIGAAVADRLAATGWNVAFTYWSPYDDRMDWTSADAEAREVIGTGLTAHGAAWHAVEADLTRPEAPGEIFAEVTGALGPVTALVMVHCESVDSSIRDTSVEAFDRHFAVNSRATWLLIKEYAERHEVPHGTGRIIAFTSDHTVHNMPYGASKGALDRITLAAAEELRELGVTANVVNPGPIDTGWMTPELRDWVLARTPLARAGRPEDAANLVGFLCSPEGGWMNGQLLESNGGFSHGVG